MRPRLDVVTIFPAYLEPLRLSLVGTARRRGVLDIDVHDLRDWTHDAHRTVDDSPFGGGAGMVMRPDVWGEAIDAVLRPDASSRVLLVPTPTGERFTQTAAAELAGVLGAGGQLVIACGRYEGIDSRVAAHYGDRPDVQVREVSLGDYVLNGGEVAALAVTEAVVRLLPGVLGNPASVVEESHGGGLLEHPTYTQPPRWRDLEVPAVLRSGDHGAAARWRRARAVQTTATRRPDLLAAHLVTVREARAADLDELTAVAAATFGLACPPDMPAADVAAFVAANLSRERLARHVKDRSSRLLIAERAGAVVGYTLTLTGEPADPQVAALVPARPAAELSKCYVLPEHHGSGAADTLLGATLAAAGAQGLPGVWLGVNGRNERARRFYERHGFVRVGPRTFDVGTRTEDDDVMVRTLTDY